MTKVELDKRVADAKAETKAALETVLGELNHGQQKKLVKNEKVKKLLDRYSVAYSE